MRPKPRAAARSLFSIVVAVFILPSLAIAQATINNVTPVSGYPNTQVTVDGAGFGDLQGMSNLWIGDNWATILTWTDTRIVAVSNATGPGPVEVGKDGQWSNQWTWPSSSS